MRQFVADASHELRTPLATVRGYAELYRQGAVREPDDVAERDRPGSRARPPRMGGLVEDLLMLARLDDQRPMRVRRRRPHRARRRRRPGRPGASPRTGTIRLSGLDGPLGPTCTSSATSSGCARCWPTSSPTPSTTPRWVTSVEIAVGTRDPNSCAVLEVRDHGAGVDPDAGPQGVRAVLPRRPVAQPARHRVAAATGSAWPSSPPSSARTTAGRRLRRPPAAARRSSSSCPQHLSGTPSTP